MKINRETQPTETLESFCDKHGLTVSVKERPWSLIKNFGLDRFHASIVNAEVARDGCLIGVHGNGATEDAALSDYCARVSGERLAINAFRGDRREILVPRLVGVWDEPPTTG